MLELRKSFSTSTKLDVCLNLIRDFENSNPKKKYKSDLETYIRESKLDDFFNEHGETIFVSTMHKAKGREFDNIFLMLDHFNINSNESKRLLYVAMTRAKETLTIHLNSNFLDNISAENIERVQDHGVFSPPDELVMHLSFGDVWLDYFITRQHLVSVLRCGDTLGIAADECRNAGGQAVLKFSSQFLKVIEGQKQKGYILRKAKVNFIVYWQKEGHETEMQVILPEVYFEK